MGNQYSHFGVIVESGSSIKIVNCSVKKFRHPSAIAKILKIFENLLMIALQKRFVQ